MLFNDGEMHRCVYRKWRRAVKTFPEVQHILMRSACGEKTEIRILLSVTFRSMWGDNADKTQSHGHEEDEYDAQGP